MDGGELAGQARNSLHMIRRALNHLNQATTAVYVRLAEDHARVALEQHAERLQGVEGIKPSADVVHIKQARK